MDTELSKTFAEMHDAKEGDILTCTSCDFVGYRPFTVGKKYVVHKGRPGLVIYNDKGTRQTQGNTNVTRFTKMTTMAKVGDFITWGTQNNARPVLEVTDKGYLVGADGFLMGDGSPYAGFSCTVSFDQPNLKVVEKPSSTPEELPIDDDTNLAIAGAGLQAQKADAGKFNPVLLEVDLVDALKSVTRVLDYGVAKYGKRAGWKEVAMDRYESAARRHRIARDQGLDFDTESGLPHLAHQICNLLFLLQTEIEENPEMDYLTFNDPPQDHRTAA